MDEQLMYNQGQESGDVIADYRPSDIGKTFATSSSSEKIKGFVAMTAIFFVLVMGLLLAAGAFDNFSIAQ
eukprot:m.128676 g.128676  ORF g.128676 m.128676 type:complete len:70 (+) comp13035_c3_seq1:151-360(+)